MSDVVAELASRVKLSDPKPTRCAACWCSADADLRFADFDTLIDRGTICDAGSMAVLESIDDLHLCENCVRDAAEIMGLKPELHARQLREIRRLELARDHHRSAERRALEECARLRQRIITLENQAEVPVSRRGRR